MAAGDELTRGPCLSSGTAILLHRLQYLMSLVSVYISAHHATSGSCHVPEADQQGSLRPFRTYEDLVVFHYNVPRHVLYATWQFSAFANNEKCPKRDVNVFLRWGSYPVISINNSSYPPYMLVEPNDTLSVSIATAYNSKSIKILPVYSPLAGDWFVSAYSPHWDDEFHQMGFGHKCHYSLNSVALWSEVNGIQNIPLGYQKTMKTSGTISYYKIYIPVDTWSFELDIWACNFTLKRTPDFNEACIKNLALQGQALPVYNHSAPALVGNLTSMDTYTFSEISPHQDCWYYLMVVSDSIITFNAKVTVLDCPVRTIEESYIQQHVDAEADVKEFDGSRSRTHPLPLYFVNESRSQESLAFGSDSSKGTSLHGACIPRYQLVRIKHTEAFSRDYLLQGQEWLTSWLTVTDRHPLITQFDILPLVDIGGTLDIGLRLEMAKMSRGRRRVVVVACVTRGRAPNQFSANVTCDNTGTTMRLSSGEGGNASLLIPYPQPDTWYIGLHTKCHINNVPIPCEAEQTLLVSLRIKLRACVFEGSNSCGRHGICQEIHKGLLSYTACKCSRGYQGWACTDLSNSITQFSILITNLALTLSNFFFLPAIYLALKRKLYAEGLIYFCVMIFSILYHACDQQFTGCAAKFEVLQYCDFFLGLLAFWVTLVAMADISVKYISFFHIMGAIIITFQIKTDKSGLLNLCVPMIIGIFIPLISYGYHCYKINRIARPKKMVKLVIGLSLATFAMVLFSFIETESNYQYVHSSWHAVIALSLIFLLPPMRHEFLRSRYAKELTNKESSAISVFNIDDRHQNNQLIMDIN